jgi:bacterial/archaeal transporter family-2 protein
MTRGMDRGLAIILTAGAGGLIALQAPINAGLGRATGSLAAAFVSFLIGTIALGAIVVLSGKAGGLDSTFDLRWYYLIGGLLGAVYVTNALIAIDVIGAGGVAALTVTGQLVASLAIDRFGLFGLDEVALSPERVFGVVLLLVGTVLVVR